MAVWANDAWVSGTKPQAIAKNHLESLTSISIPLLRPLPAVVDQFSPEAGLASAYGNTKGPGSAHPGHTQRWGCGSRRPIAADTIHFDSTILVGFRMQTGMHAQCPVMASKKMTLEKNHRDDGEP